jgi:hypothetical protein
VECGLWIPVDALLVQLLTFLCHFIISVCPHQTRCLARIVAAAVVAVRELDCNLFRVEIQFMRADNHCP